MEGFFLEKYNVAQGLVPVDLNTAANTGLRISMKDAKRVIFIVTMGDSTAGATDFSLKQHNAATAGTSKALSVANPYFHKAGAATTFTKVTPGSATDNYVPTAFDNEPGVAVFEVLAEDLDVNGDFAWVSLDIADAGAAKIGAVIAIVEPKAKPAYGNAV